MNVPENLLYTKDHEWISIKNSIATIGITDYAQGELGDIIFIEFPSIDEQFKTEDVFGTAEAVKTVADLFSPIDGKIIKVNSDLEDNPELVNNDPYGKGWLVKMEISNNDTSKLLTNKEYIKII